MLKYAYTTKEQQNLPVPYPFVEYEGNDFIMAYVRSRKNAIEFFEYFHKTVKDRDSKSEIYTKQQLLEKINSGEMLKIDDILNSLNDLIEHDKSPEILSILKNLRKKGELRKLKTHYKGEKLLSSGISESKEADNINTYVLLSSCLAKHLKFNKLTENLQSLSTLLKINDLVISRIEEIYDKNIDFFTNAIAQEMKSVLELKQMLAERKIVKTLTPFDIEQKNKKTIENLGIVAQDKPRARAYMQGLVKSGMIPSHLIVLDETFGNQSKKDDLDKSVEGIEFFNSEEPIMRTAEKWRIPYSVVYAKDFNDSKVVEALAKTTQKYYVFSGTGILKKEILNAKRLIHAHPGWLPTFRGSTTFLFSLLAQGDCSATCFIMNEGIDTGDVITMKKFSPPDKNTDLSRIYDPYIRSMVIVETVKQLKESGELSGYRQNSEEGETYFTIHPVLRTVAVGYYKGEVEDFSI